VSVFKTAKSPFYWYSFDIDRNRFSGTTKCTTRKAAKAFEELEKARQKAALAAQAKVRNSLAIDDVAKRYWLNVGQFHSADHAETTSRDLARLVTYFGQSTLMTDIGDAEVTALVAWRRGQQRKGVQVGGNKNPPAFATKKETAKRKSELNLYNVQGFVSPSTVNRSTTEVLKKLFNFCKVNEKVRFDNEPTWRNHKLKEPDPETVQREIKKHEAKAIDDNMREDYAPLYAFTMASGWRSGAAVTLTWDEVDFDAGLITKKGKGGRLVTLQLTPSILAIIEPLKGHHPTAVFTYVAKATRKAGECNTSSTDQVANRHLNDQGSNPTLIKGQRYPITKEGLKTRWRRTKADAGVSTRFHDLRHTFASQLLRETGNLRIVQKALGHKNIKTTTRYAHAQADEVAAAIEAMNANRVAREITSDTSRDVTGSAGTGEGGLAH